MRVLIVGAGGHGQVVADILLRMRDAGAAVEPVGFVDDDSTLAGSQLLGVPVLGTIESLPGWPHDALVVAVGDNRIRAAVVSKLAAAGERFMTAVHPRAVIAPDVELGPGVMVCAEAVVNTGSQVGSHVIFNTGCTADHHAVVGDFAHLGPGSHLGGEVKIGNGALVGIGAAVLPRTRIGAWAVVGAGSVVTKDVMDAATVFGVPARVIQDSVLKTDVEERA